MWRVVRIQKAYSVENDFFKNIQFPSQFLMTASTVKSLGIESDLESLKRHVSQMRAMRRVCVLCLAIDYQTLKSSFAAAKGEFSESSIIAAIPVYSFNSPADLFDGAEEYLKQNYEVIIFNGQTCVVYSAEISRSRLERSNDG